MNPVLHMLAANHRKKEDKPADFFPHSMGGAGAWARLRVTDISVPYANAVVVEAYHQNQIGQVLYRIDALCLRKWRARDEDIMQVNVGTEFVIALCKGRRHPSGLSIELISWDHVKEEDK